MIFFTNTKIDLPHLMFIGRWTPFHKGHKYIIESKRKENPDKPILIQIRETNYDAYPSHVRAEFIKTWMQANDIRGTIMIIPDVHGVYYGRGVGYKIEEIVVPDEIKAISATSIRKGISGEDKEMDWEDSVASKSFANLLSPKVSDIIENGHVVWLTGCPCAGKTTISKALAEKIQQVYPRLKLQVLDGDVMRGTPMAENVGFSKEDRAKHIRRMGQLAQMFADHGILVIASFVSPEKKIRNEIKKTIGSKRFTEIYVKASKKERIARDVKGMYAKAISGEIDNFTGYNAQYQPPVKPAVICNTDKESVEKSVEKSFHAIFS